MGEKETRGVLQHGTEHKSEGYRIELKEVEMGVWVSMQCNAMAIARKTKA